jgi:NADPH-dependent ferric siderophore reductase
VPDPDPQVTTTGATRRVRREPPAFRTVAVRGTVPLSPRLIRVTVGGDELDGMTIDLPAASVRLLLPPPGASELVMPAWDGNEFLLPDGTRPTIRTLTPRRLDPSARALDVDVVVHDGGALSDWAQAARPGDPVAVSGPGRGYSVDPEASDYLLAGDETAIPAMSQLLEHLPDAMPVRVLVEIADPAARLARLQGGRPESPDSLTSGSPASGPDGPAVSWHELPPGSPPGDALVAAVRAVAEDVGPAPKVWAAGEAAAVQRIRRLLFEDAGLPRSQAAIRGYWKHGRTGDGGD